LTDEIITLAHGAGGIQTQRLIEEVFAKAFDDPLLTHDDAAVLDCPQERIAMTTDGFVVSPAFFNGGDIGKLSICGTVNDLACMCARPMYLTCSFIIEEGFKISDLKKIVSSMADTAKEAGVHIVAGDTKVTGKGQCDGIFITTAGVGGLCGPGTGGAMAREGDAVIVTGDIGRHGCAIMLARGGFGITADIASDCAPLWGLVSGMLETGAELHAIRDATRGGVGTVLCEIAVQSGVCVEIEEEALPVSPHVTGFCGLLGLEPLYMACEGRMVVFAPQACADALLGAIHSSEYGRDAAVIGRVTRRYPGRVIALTAAGGERLLAQPSGELLPRIC
jgi:hydrogenase expression/formation protein HypE